MLLLGCLLLTTGNVSAMTVDSDIVVVADDGFDWAAGDDGDDAFPSFEDEYFDTPTEIADPIEGINRGIFWFNDRLYVFFLKPLARGLRYVPKPARQGIDNFFNNIGAPLRAGNALLQLKIEAMSRELLRFLINSTVGLGGLIDVTKGTGLERVNEDFGQTLGHYGVGPGIYIVMPLLGPSTLRDVLGDTVDALADPIYLNTDTNRDLLTVKAIKTVNTLSLDNDTYETIKRDSLDPYLFIRNTYTQHRQALIDE